VVAAPCRCRGLGTGVKVRAIIKLIEDDGWRQMAIRGSHRQYRHPTKLGRVTVPGKPSDDLHPRPKRSILPTPQYLLHLMDQSAASQRRFSARRRRITLGFIATTIAMGTVLALGAMASGTGPRPASSVHEAVLKGGAYDGISYEIAAGQREITPHQLIAFGTSTALPRISYGFSGKLDGSGRAIFVALSQKP